VSESHVKAVAWWFDKHPWVPPDARLSIESILAQVEPEAPVPALVVADKAGTIAITWAPDSRLGWAGIAVETSGIVRCAALPDSYWKADAEPIASILRAPVEEVAAVEALPADVAAGLDPGIRGVVEWLRAEGFDTMDSGDGVTKGADGSPAPHVFIRVERATMCDVADRLRKVCVARGIKLRGEAPDLESALDEDWPFIQAHYDPEDGIATVLLGCVDDATLKAIG